MKSEALRAVRVRAVMLLARLFRVPIDVRQTFFMKGINSKISSSS